MADFAWLHFRELLPDGTFVEVAKPVDSIEMVGEADQDELLGWLDDDQIPKGMIVCVLKHSNDDDSLFIEGTTSSVLQAMELAAKTKSVQRPRV